MHTLVLEVLLNIFVLENKWMLYFWTRQTSFDISENDSSDYLHGILSPLLYHYGYLYNEKVLDTTVLSFSVYGGNKSK